MKWLIFTFLSILSLNNVQSYFITVDAYDEECFFDKVEFGTKMELFFLVVEETSPFISVRLVGPDAKILYKHEEETNSRYELTASTTGAYTYCFSNSQGYPKLVMFEMRSGESPTHIAEEKAKSGNGTDDKLDDMIRDLSAVLWSVKSEQDYMTVRDRIHREVSENTNRRVVTWSFFEAATMLIISIGQVFYLKRYFEIKRLV